MSSTTPPPADGGPEYLDQGGGQPIPQSDEGSGRGGRRTAVIAGGAVVALGLVGGGVWAAMSFFASGPQPAEALPASTIGYASVDLDPSGGQKIEAFRMISKFPAIEKELGGFDADDDILEKAFEDADCEGLDYADDVKPWLGYRFAVAAVDLGEEMPTPVGVIQVTDSGAAEDGLAQLLECSGGETGGFVVDGDWAVVAETDEIAQQVVDATGEGTLADDTNYQERIGDVGEAGVMSMYVAPEVGKYVTQLFEQFSQGMVPGLPSEVPPMEGELDGMEGDLAMPEEMTKALEEFDGMAATVRFSDGALEFEAAAGGGDSEQMSLFSTDKGDDVLATLPGDTAAAFGLGFSDGWLDAALESVANASGGEMTVDDLKSELEGQLGLTVDDIEGAFGDSAALAFGSDFDPETLFSSSDGSDVPIGLKVRGDADAVDAVVAKINESAGGEVFGTDADGDVVAIGPNPDYRSSLLEDGDLGDSDVFQNVIREADEASAILFVNFEAGDWLKNLAEGDAEAEANLDPLEGLGFTSWVDDDTSHVVLRLTTD